MKVEMHTEKINASPQNWFWGKKKKKRLLCRVGAQNRSKEGMVLVTDTLSKNLQEKLTVGGAVAFMQPTEVYKSWQF